MENDERKVTECVDNPKKSKDAKEGVQETFGEMISASPIIRQRAMTLPNGHSEISEFKSRKSIKTMDEKVNTPDEPVDAFRILRNLRHSVSLGML